jgi:hypothetical protein
LPQTCSGLAKVGGKVCGKGTPPFAPILVVSRRGANFSAPDASDKYQVSATGSGIFLLKSVTHLK